MRVRLFLASALMDVAMGVASMALPLAALALGAGPAQLGLLGGLQRVPYVLLCLPMGRLSDRFGRKPMALAGAFALALGLVALSFAHALTGLYLLIPILGIATAAFWPAVQAWVGDVGRATSLGGSAGGFNVAWSAGAMSGTLIAGLSFGWSVHAPFWLAAAIALGIGAALGAPARRSAKSGASPDGAAVPRASAVAERHMYAAFAANFATWFLWGILVNVFPELGDALGAGALAISALVSLTGLARTIAFAWVARRAGWLYRPFPLVIALALAAAAAGWMLIGPTPWALAPSFVLAGLAIGITYHLSLYYALDREARSGSSAGAHEATLIAGMSLGSLLGGFAAQAWSLRAPYVLAVGVCLVAYWVCRRLWRSARLATGTSGHPSR